MPPILPLASLLPRLRCLYHMHSGKWLTSSCYALHVVSVSVDGPWCASTGVVRSSDLAPRNYLLFLQQLHASSLSPSQLEHHTIKKKEMQEKVYKSFLSPIFIFCADLLTYGVGKKRYTNVLFLIKISTY